MIFSGVGEGSRCVWNDTVTAGSTSWAAARKTSLKASSPTFLWLYQPNIGIFVIINYLTTTMSCIIPPTARDYRRNLRAQHQESRLVLRDKPIGHGLVLVR